MPAYAEYTRFRVRERTLILTRDNKSDARIHGYDKTQLLMRALLRFRKPASTVALLARLLFACLFLLRSPFKGAIQHASNAFLNSSLGFINFIALSFHAPPWNFAIWQSLLDIWPDTMDLIRNFVTRTI
jgi:hypothetical protein